MRFSPLRFAAILSVAGLAASVAHSQTYTIVGASSAKTLESGNWSWDGFQLTAYRTAIQDGSNFGGAGISSPSSVLVGVIDATIDSTTLAGANCFIAPWVGDGDLSNAEVTSILDFWSGGGDLFILADDADHDRINAALGIPTIGTSNPNWLSANGTNPLFNGAFGTSPGFSADGAFGFFSAATIAGFGGTVAGLDDQGNVIAAFWGAGAFTGFPNAGKLVLVADVDSLTSPFGGANYSPLNNEGTFGLNTTDFLVRGAGGNAAAPEPTTMALMGLGLGALIARRRRR